MTELSSQTPPDGDGSATRWLLFGILVLGMGGFVAFSALKPRASPPPAAIASDPFLISGREIYLSRCVSCHGELGRGDGPIAKGLAGPPPRNFAEDEWKHGDRPEQALAVVTRGVPDTSMSGWASAYSPEELRSVTAYVYHLAGKPVPEALRSSR